MTIIKFEDIVAWRKAQELAVLVYGQFKNCRDFGFKDQIQRAVISIGNNIAEGYERQSNKEFKQFLYIAKGSCGEVRSMAHIASTLGYITTEQSGMIYKLSFEVSKIISGFIKTL